jgi:hypothetical protein
LTNFSLYNTNILTDSYCEIFSSLFFLFFNIVNASSGHEDASEEVGVASKALQQGFMTLVFRDGRFPEGASLAASKRAIEERLPVAPIPLNSWDGVSRGFCSAHIDPFFYAVLNHVSDLADGMSTPPVVYDFGAALGITTEMLCLVGGHAHGIESARITKSEREKMLLLLKAYQPLIAEFKLKGNFKYNTYNAFELPEEIFLPLSADAAFLGNFIHMFDICTAMGFVNNVLLKLVKPGRTVFCSVDGIGLALSGNFVGLPVLEGAQVSPREAYLHAKSKGARFPSVMFTQRLVQKVQRSETAVEYVALGVIGIEHDEAVGSDGSASAPCRRATFLNGSTYEDFARTTCGYTGLTKDLFIEKILFSDFDYPCIQLVFPPEKWEVALQRRGAFYEALPDTMADEDVISWCITATKKS